MKLFGSGFLHPFFEFIHTVSPENSFIWKFQEWNASVQINEVSLYSVQSLGVGMFSRLSRTSVTCEDDFSRNEDEEYDFGFDHAINEAREQLRLIAEKKTKTF